MYVPLTKIKASFFNRDYGQLLQLNTSEIFLSKHRKNHQGFWNLSHKSETKGYKFERPSGQRNMTVTL